MSNIELGRQKAPLHLLYKICTNLGLETRESLPLNSEIAHPDVVPVEVEGEVRYMPPKAAEALKRLQAESETQEGMV